MNRRWIVFNELEMTATRKNKSTYFYDDITTPIYTQGLGHKDNIVKY
jgi:hypothetical protein